MKFRQHHLRSHRRSQHGSALALVAMCSLVIIATIVAAFKIYSYLGGSQEFKNSVDAATLNEAAHAPEVTITAATGTLFEDVADTRHQLGLMNINRAVGKGYLIDANGQKMIAEGYEDPKTLMIQHNSMQAFTETKNATIALQQKLMSHGVLSPYFDNFAVRKPAKLLGESVRLDATTDTRPTCVYPGEESNLRIPDTAAVANDSLPPICNAANTSFVEGYVPLLADNNAFYLTTFHANEGPHLIAMSTFEQTRKLGVGGSPIKNGPATIPIPNAFKDSGVLEGNLSLAASACAVANPMRSYNISIPHAFLTITVLPAVGTLIVEGVPCDQATYAPKQGKTSVVEGVQLKLHQGILMGYCNIGNEYGPSNHLWDALVSIPGGKQQLETKVLQRIKEFAPGYDMGQLQKLLMQDEHSLIPSEPLRQVKQHTWFIYPSYSMPDSSDVPVVMIARPDGGDTLPAWLVKEVPPEGGDKLIAQFPSPVRNVPNWSWSVIIGGLYASDDTYCENSGLIGWMPRTGYKQDLGDLFVLHTTTINFTGEPPKPGGSGSEAGPPKPVAPSPTPTGPASGPKNSK